MKPLRVLSLCDGISCGQVALERAGIPVEVYYASEIKPEAIEVTQYNYPNTIQLGDLTKYDFSNIKDIDLFLCGSPCQDLSSAHKKREGLLGEKSSLFFKCVEIMKLVKPKYFLFENVIMTQENYSVFSEILGCYPIMIDSALVSAQTRHRNYWTNIGPVNYNLFGFPTCAIPQPEDKKIYYQDIVTSGYVDRLKARCLLQNGGGMKNPLKDKKRMLHRYYDIGFINLVFEEKDNPLSCRHINQIEAERLQTLPEGYTKILDRNKACGCIGDGWTVDVIVHIFSFME